MNANDRFLGPEGVEELMLLFRQALDQKAGAEETAQALAGKADLVEGKVDPAQLPAMDYDPAGSAEDVRKALKEALTAGLSAKQDTLSGIPGQFVGFDAAGRPVPQTIDIPEASTGYVHRFAAANWIQGVGEVTLTVAASLHKMTGSEAACSALAGAAGAYKRTWAATQTWASAAGNDITLHAPAAYDGCAVLTLC